MHVEHPGEVLNYGQQYGSLLKMKVENMREQHNEIVGDDKAPAKEKLLMVSLQFQQEKD